MRVNAMPLLVLLTLAAPAVAQDVPATRPAAKPALTLDALLARFKEAPGLYARFEEKKYMTLLARPLVNSGTLHFMRGGRVARHVTKPSRSTVLIDERTIRMGDAEHYETLSLKGNPVLRQFLDSFLKILTGDRAALEKSYTLSFYGVDKKGDHTFPRWELSLKPKLSPMKDAIQLITFQGRDLVMHELRIDEVGGDKSITTFSDVDPGRVYTKAEQAKVFVMPKKKTKKGAKDAKKAKSGKTKGTTR